MQKWVKDNLVSIITGILAPVVLWIIKDYLPQDWDKYYIPMKINLFFLSIFIIALIVLLLKIHSFKGKIDSQASEIKDLKKFSKVESYDLLQDSKGFFYCIRHEVRICETGPMGYSKGSYWCPDCQQWYEKHEQNNENSIGDFFITI